MMEISGYFDDEGNELNPDLYPKPALCLTCAKNDIPDWEEELLCNLNRLDQRNGLEFSCGAYEKIEQHL